MDVSKRGEEMLVSGSDDGYIGVWRIMFSVKHATDQRNSFGTHEPRTPSPSYRQTSPSPQ